MSAALAPLVKAPRRHAPGEVLVDLAVMLADGGECVLDLKTAPGRRLPATRCVAFGEVASQPTAWRLLDAIDEELAGRLAGCSCCFAGPGLGRRPGTRKADPGLRRHAGQPA